MLAKTEHQYTLRETGTRKVKKKSTQQALTVSSLNPQSDGSSFMDQLGQLFHSMVGEMTKNMSDNDLVCFVLQSLSLDYLISLPVMPRRELNA